MYKSQNQAKLIFRDRGQNRGSTDRRRVHEADTSAGDVPCLHLGGGCVCTCTHVLRFVHFAVVILKSL